VLQDLHRTLSSHGAFQKYAAGTRAMRRVLAAYAIFCPAVGYCQGMSFVVALLLFITRQYPTEESSTVAWGEEDDPEAEEDTFWILHFFIEGILPPAFFGSAPSQGLPELRGLQRALLVINRLVETRQPEVAAHLEELGVPVSCVTVRWLPCLFAGTMPVESVLRVWDMMMVEKMVAVYRAAIAVLEMQKDALLAARGPEDVAAATTGTIAGFLDASPLVYWMHSSWPWLASWVYPPDITEGDTHGLWADIRKAEEAERQAEAAEDPNLSMSFLELSMSASTILIAEGYEGIPHAVELIQEGSWCLVRDMDADSLGAVDSQAHGDPGTADSRSVPSMVPSL